MRLIGISLGEFGDERALADPGLTAEQYDLSSHRIDLGQQIGQQTELSISLQEHEPRVPNPPHRHMCAFS